MTQDAPAEPASTPATDATPSPGPSPTANAVDTADEREPVELIKELGDLRNSQVLVYFLGDRSGAPAGINEDQVRPLYEHLRLLGKVERLDLFVYSRGGAIEVPWKLVSVVLSDFRPRGSTGPRSSRRAAHRQTRRRLSPCPR